MLVTFGGALLVVVVLVVMIRIGAPPIVRVLVIGIPVVLVSWWLLEPFFVDDVVEEKFSTSIDAAQREPDTAPSTPPSTAPGATTAPSATTPTAPTAPAGPQLLGSGTFVGLAGHYAPAMPASCAWRTAPWCSGSRTSTSTTDPTSSCTSYPGAESYSPGDGICFTSARSKGNVGNQTYDLPADFEALARPVDRAGLVRGIHRRVRRSVACGGVTHLQSSAF